jgi:ubiquinone/menaquinone biosynthesis C-methylase UbiE
MKDLFSTRSDSYAKFRPSYPLELFKFLIPLVKNHSCAWDCGTGNGQVALILSDFFTEVYGTDISTSQLENAANGNNIFYSQQPAENTNFENEKFDLITVAQAIHWFDFEKFYKEVRRTLKPEGIFAVIGYGEAIIDPDTDAIMKRFHDGLLGPYWDKERKYIDEKYQTIPFPFEEIQTPEFHQLYNWDLDRFLGYVSTWSALKHYITATGIDPLQNLRKDLEAVWDVHAFKTIIFPTLVRMGKLQ